MDYGGWQETSAQVCQHEEAVASIALRPPTGGGVAYTYEITEPVNGARDTGHTAAE